MPGKSSIDKPRVTFNVDTWEGDGATREPSVQVTGGRPFTWADPQSLPWQALDEAQDALNRGNVRPMLRLALGDQYDAFLDASRELPARHLGELITRWQRGNGVTQAGEPAASSTS